MMWRLRKSNSLKRLDKTNPKPKKDEILAFCVVRDERIRLPYFLDYHKNLGVDRFYIVDNDSSDGTTEYLLERDDCHVFHTSESYGQSHCGVNWQNSLIARYGRGHWGLVLDPDELLVYPHCETVGLAELTQYLDQKEAVALSAFLLDMYSDKAIASTTYKSGQAFLSACPFFDKSGYEFAERLGVPHKGGPRERVFMDEFAKVLPVTADSSYLAKVPLVRWHSGIRLRSSHSVKGLKGRYIGKMTAALLHFKFFDDFAAKNQREALREEHWKEAEGCKFYSSIMQAEPDLSLYSEESEQYRDSLQLVELGLIKTPAQGWPRNASTAQ